jgi:hypothetical protein
MENLANWQFEYLTKTLGTQPDNTVMDMSNGILTLAELLIPYLDSDNYQGNVVKKMTIRPEVDQSVIQTHTELNPHLDIIQNMQCTTQKQADFAWEHEVFCHLAVYDAMLCLANVGKVSNKFYFSYFDQSTAPYRHINQKKSHPEVNFYYTKSQIETMCKHTGWQVTECETQNHPLGRTIMVATQCTDC